MGEIIIRSERDSDDDICRHILESCLTPPWIVRALAMRAAPEFNKDLSIVAERDGEIIGYGLYARSSVEAGGPEPAIQPAAMLTLVAVKPEHRKQGVGGRIVRHGVDRCRGFGLGLVFSVFMPGFFARFGFKPARPFDLVPVIRIPDSEFLVLDANGGLLGKIKGKVRFPTGIVFR